jgi:hypothetical protein
MDFSSQAYFAVVMLFLGQQDCNCSLGQASLLIERSY